MDFKRTKLNLISVPTDVQLTLYLIREGLKARRLFDSLAKIGFDDSTFFSDNVGVVLAIMGFDDSDDTYNWYSKLLEDYANMPEDDRDNVSAEAMKIYSELLIKKNKSKEVKAANMRNH